MKNSIEVQRIWNVKAKVIPVITRDDSNHFKITQTIPEQHTGKARNYGSARTATSCTAHTLRQVLI
jgi:hypothetical protein